MHLRVVRADHAQQPGRRLPLSRLLHPLAPFEPTTLANSRARSPHRSHAGRSSSFLDPINQPTAGFPHPHRPTRLNHFGANIDARTSTIRPPLSDTQPPLTAFRPRSRSRSSASASRRRRASCVKRRCKFFTELISRPTFPPITGLQPAAPTLNTLPKILGRDSGKTSSIAAPPGPEASRPCRLPLDPATYPRAVPLVNPRGTVMRHTGAHALAVYLGGTSLPPLAHEPPRHPCRYALCRWARWRSWRRERSWRRKPLAPGPGRAIALGRWVRHRLESWRRDLRLHSRQHERLDSVDPGESAGISPRVEGLNSPRSEQKGDADTVTFVRLSHFGGLSGLIWPNLHTLEGPFLALRGLD